MKSTYLPREKDSEVKTASLYLYFCVESAAYGQNTQHWGEERLSWANWILSGNN